MNFSRISLKKQLSLILATIVFFSLVFLVPTINDNVARITDDEMYITLTMAQNSFYQHEVDLQDSLLDRQIYHLFFNVTEGVSMPTTLTQNDEVLAMTGIFKEALDNVIKTDESFYRSKGVYEDYDMYYQILEVEDDTYLISLLHTTYSNQLVSSLRNEIIYMLYTALFTMGTILFLWVHSLLEPLTKIRKYVSTMYTEEPYQIEIDRGDEIGILYDSLMQMKEDLRIQSKHRDEMLHNISHDLKTPIALIKTYTESIRDGVYPYGTMESSMDIILENASRLEYKVTSLLHLNHLDYSNETKQDQRVNMKLLIEHLVQQMQALHPNIEFKLFLNDAYFTGDTEHWRICIENILENAYRYVESTIVIWLRRDYLEIYNDGPNIPNENIRDLFLPYKKGVKGQFGLGLSIVLKTVEIYEYELEAINLDVGVSFVIYK